MKKTHRCFKLLISIFCLLQYFLFIVPAQAANRNDALLDLKDTFNTPVSGRSSITTTIISILICGIVIWVIYYYASQEKKTQRHSHEQHQEKIRLQRSSSQQKRNWYRLKTRGEFKWVPAELAPNVKENKYRHDQLIDVSGGGLCFSTAEPIANGDEIKLILSLGEKNPLVLNGKVIRAVEDAGVHTVSIEYIGIRDGQRDRIISWILKNQRNIMQNQKSSDQPPRDSDK